MTMTLTKTENRMAQADTAREAAARARFVAAAWAGKPAEELVNLAHTVGLPTADADKLAADVAAAKAHADAAERLELLRRGAAEAERELEQVTATQREVIAEAEARIDAAAEALEVARRAAQSAEDSARRVVDADALGLVPDNALPQACVAIMEAQQAEAEKLEWHKRWTAGKEQAAGLRNRVAGLRRKAEGMKYHGGHELTDTGETRDWRWYEARAKEAEAELSHVEKEIEAAKKAAGIA